MAKTATPVKDFLFGLIELEVPKKTGYMRIPACIECEEILSEHELMYSNGICPYCGFDSKSTICNYKNIVVRKVYTHSFLGFKWGYYEEKQK